MSLTDKNITGWPGQNINVSVEATDELGNPAGTLALLEFNSFVIDVIVKDYSTTMLQYPIYFIGGRQY